MMRFLLRQWLTRNRLVILTAILVIVTGSIAAFIFTAGICSIAVTSFIVIELSKRCENISGLLVIVACQEGLA